MRTIHIVRDYPHSPAKVWRAVTDAALIPLWTATGAGARPEGFTPTVGTEFQFIARPKPGWSGIVDCVVLEADEPRLLRYSWTDHGGGETTEVTYRIEPHAAGTRFTYDHTGFTGTGGLLMAQILGHVRRKMLRVGLPAVLNDLDDSGMLRPGSTLKPRT
ncbi:SRPBCC family protein [Streptomyces silvisoli]|uniref:SRPBCC domain-containing protein n=1 Tax=Streptomyces silvisoli TaxID=3034235 RepID=A0ABT5ZMA0_9ACTN|nr:SRPBCC domain-containing protein [Streptomyces silvisoli]MDF3290710.1 SRPBCC domain-containing protein [Streptomyces silvisoli]